LSLLSISYIYLGGNSRVTSVASRDMLPNEAARADLPTVSTVYPDKSSTAVSPIICSKALENSAIVSIATAAIVVGGGVTVGPIVAAYFAVPVAFAAEMLAPTGVEEVVGAAAGETLSSVSTETMAEFSSAFERIMCSTVELSTTPCRGITGFEPVTLQFLPLN
jgi:hypothetical protein